MPNGRRLIVASNRGPYRQTGSGARRRWSRSAGGLVTALDPVLRDRGGVWVSAGESPGRTAAMDPPPNADGAYELAYAPVPRSSRKGFYETVSNAVLWPLLHGFRPTVRPSEAPWEDYVRANRAFADSILEHAGTDDVIWIHDYQLMLVPAMLRERRPNCRIAWFCHVPWPAPELFRILPPRDAFLKGLLGADLLGFHTDEYADNFCATVASIRQLPFDEQRVALAGSRPIKVTVAPIGIPVDDVQAVASSTVVQEKAAQIRERVGNRAIVMGADRLDYTKGIPERLLGYARFLERNRSARDRSVFIQIMVPSRTGVQAYADLKAEIDGLVGEINGRFSKTGQVAIHYLYRNLDAIDLYAHYRAADVALITPLRDGMNLIAHEYVAARSQEGGVLILSEFAGAASYLGGALQVNPFDIDAIADRIEEALSMPESEQRDHMQEALIAVRKMDVHHWTDRFLQDLPRSDVSRSSLRPPQRPRIWKQPIPLHARGM